MHRKNRFNAYMFCRADPALRHLQESALQQIPGPAKPLRIVLVNNRGRHVQTGQERNPVADPKISLDVKPRSGTLLGGFEDTNFIMCDGVCRRAHDKCF